MILREFAIPAASKEKHPEGSTQAVAFVLPNKVTKCSLVGDQKHNTCVAHLNTVGLVYSAPYVNRDKCKGRYKENLST